MSAEYSQSSMMGPDSAGTDSGRRVIPQKVVIGLVVGAVVLLLLLTVGVVWLALNFPGQIEAIRDVFIMVFAVAACSSIIVLVMLLVAVIRLINMLEFEIKPILEKTNETIDTVKVTTAFVSSNVVQPAITLNSYLSGIRRGFRVLFGDPGRNLPD